MSHFPVYLIEYLGAPRNHHAIFVATEADGTGFLFHVRGDIQNGMQYESRKTPQKPDLSNTFVSKSQLGWVRVQDLSRIDPICRGNPPPAKQFNGPRRINPNRPLRRCQEWTNEVIGTLKAQGVLLNATMTASGSSSNIDGSSGGSHATAASSHRTELRDGDTRDGYWYWSLQHQKWYHLNDDGTYKYS
ncbi:hypothetical protein BCR34DRAFT_566734 [Clohesyomyces aquaticus]|uniref:Uncharacterized protein n=1 Tax=Clohesyomyces aquaticus TaxID=1231657 RepID=A0A1Y1ZJU8_9PLEO|nr:hypothetical protein BCR34DRAFT_566734 [Clohesyomyces aquaticus]